MFNLNSGYVGYSRSLRSQEAIDGFEVPTTMIKKSLVEDFLRKNADDFTAEELAALKKVSAVKWKFVADRYVTPSSWHHTSSYFNKTNHYSLFSIASKILEVKETLDEEYKSRKAFEKADKEKEKKNYSFGVCKVEEWEKRGKYFKLKATPIVAGIIVGDWLYCKEYNTKTSSTIKYKISAKKTVWTKTYNSFKELAKENEDFKNLKEVFETLIKEKGAKK